MRVVHAFKTEGQIHTFKNKYGIHSNQVSAVIMSLSRRGWLIDKKTHQNQTVTYIFKSHPDKEQSHFDKMIDLYEKSLDLW